VRDAVVARLARLNLERVLLRQERFVSRFLQLELEAFQVYTPSIVLTLGVLSLVLTLITVNRLVQDQRREIGTLLALGYRRGQVLRGYLRLGGWLGAAGGVLGTGLAFVFRDLFAGTHARAMGVPEVVPVTVPALLTTGFVAAMVGTMVATALPVWRLVRLPPQMIIREPMQDGFGAGRGMRRLVASTAALPLSARLGIRNLLRRPRRTAATVLAIAFSLGVSIAYTVSLTSALRTTELVFGRERWDLAVDFLYPVRLEDLLAIRAGPGVTSVDPYFRRFAEVGIDGRFEAAGILGVDPGSGMKRTLVKTGRFLSGGADELLLSQDLARRLGVRSGARVVVRIRSGREFVFRVVGVSGEIVPAQIMMPFRQAQMITELEGTATGVYVATSGPVAPLAASLGALPYVAKVTTKAGVAAAFRKLTSEMLQLVYLAAGVSVLIAMVLIFMGVTAAISERQADYATLQCLGYGRRRLGAIILAQAFGEGGLAALLSLPIGVALAVYLNVRMSAAWHEIITVVRPADVAQVLLTAFVLIPVAAYPGLRALDRLNIAGALAARSLE
jgi:putative ABC transport system permease protein